MNPSQNDGPTSIYYQSDNISAYHDVAVLKTKQFGELTPIENKIYDYCKIHFLKYDDRVEFHKKCRLPITIFAVSSNAYYVSIDEANDHPNFFIGIIPKKDDSVCYPFIRGFTNFMRLIICYPHLNMLQILTHEANPTPEVSSSNSRRDELLSILKLSPFTSTECHQLLSKIKTYSPIILVPK